MTKPIPGREAPAIGGQSGTKSRPVAGGFCGTKDFNRPAGGQEKSRRLRKASRTNPALSNGNVLLASGTSSTLTGDAPAECKLPLHHL
jgi:hypothetical protein